MHFHKLGVWTILRILFPSTRAPLLYSHPYNGRRPQPFRPETARPDGRGGERNRREEENGRWGRRGAPKCRARCALVGPLSSRRTRLDGHAILFAKTHFTSSRQPVRAASPLRKDKTSQCRSLCFSHTSRLLSLLQILASGGHVALYDYDTAAGAWVSLKERESGGLLRTREEREQNNASVFFFQP